MKEKVIPEIKNIKLKNIILDEIKKHTSPIQQEECTLDEPSLLKEDKSILMEQDETLLLSNESIEAMMSQELSTSEITENKPNILEELQNIEMLDLYQELSELFQSDNLAYLDEEFLFQGFEKDDP